MWRNISKQDKLIGKDLGDRKEVNFQQSTAESPKSFTSEVYLSFV